MTTEALGLLGQYGAIGIILAAVLGLFLWSFRKLFEHVLAQQIAFRAYLDESVKALNEIRAAIHSGNEQILRRMDDCLDHNHSRSRD